MRTLSVVLVASALIAGLSACSADAPELVRATVQTIPDTTIERPESPTIPETTAVTTTPAVEATTATTAGAITTTAGATTTFGTGISTPIFSTARLSDETSLDTYPVVTGEWTDRDFAMVAAGSRREVSRQSGTRSPDLVKLIQWFEEQYANRYFASLSADTLAGIEYRTGSINDFVVYQVELLDPDLVLVTSCERNNSAKYEVGDPDTTTDDKLIQNDLETKHSQRALISRGDRWLVSEVLALKAEKCASLFS